MVHSLSMAVRALYAHARTPTHEDALTDSAIFTDGAGSATYNDILAVCLQAGCVVPPVDEVHVVLPARERVLVLLEVRIGLQINSLLSKSPFCFMCNGLFAIDSEQNRSKINAVQPFHYIIWIRDVFWSGSSGPGSKGARLRSPTSKHILNPDVATSYFDV